MGAAGRSAALTLKLCSSSWPAGRTGTVSPGRTLPRAQCNRRTACWRRQRASELGRPRCGSAPHAAQLHIESPWRGLVRNNLWVRQEGDAPVSQQPSSIFSGQLPPKEFDWTAPGGKPRPFKKCWAAAFSHSPKFLGWNKIRGECCIISLLIIRCFYTACRQRPSLPLISSFLVLLVVSRHNVFYRTSS